MVHCPHARPSLDHRLIHPRARWRADLVVVAVVTLGCYALSSALEINEWMSHVLARYERWQADELPLSLTVLAASLAWFATRRRRAISRPKE
jgi:hypothetical protein